jgi:hypothetical protein
MARDANDGGAWPERGLAVVILLAAGTGVAGQLLGRPWSRQHAERPIADLPRCLEIDLGTGPPHGVLRHTVSLGNAGDSPLAFKTATGCGCLHVDPSEGAIAPGRRVEIALELKLASRGQPASGTLRIETNDPAHAERSYRVFGRCPAAMEPDVAAINFGLITPSKPAQWRRVTFNNPLAPLSEFRCRFDPTLVEVDTADFNELGRSIAVRPRTREGSGESSCLITLEHSTQPDLSLELPVYWQSRSTYYAAPSLIVGGPPDGQPARVIVGRGDGLPLGRMIRHDGHPNCDIRDPHTEPMHRRVLEVLVRSSGEGETSKRKEVAIHFEGLEEPLILPVIVDR